MKTNADLKQGLRQKLQNSDSKLSLDLLHRAGG